MKLDATVQIDGADVRTGTLFTNVRGGTQSATFEYERSYLADPRAFAISPDLPLLPGPQHAQGRPMFLAFEDCMPDRWGRNLMLRAERNAARREHRTARTLFEGDMLALVNDATRQGAVRLWANGCAQAPAETGVPREVGIPSLLSSADRAARDMDADVRDLLAAGSSLGGARPKASVTDERGRLMIAKFPKANENLLDDTCAWERVALQLAARCGMRTPATRLLRVAGRAVLLLDRFDREGDRRIPYLSGMSAVEGTDGGSYSYLELADFIEREGVCPEQDLQELWRRMLFSCAIGNTDDHLRNQGFLRETNGWRLSPLFDVNPTPGDQPKYLSTALDFDERLATPEAALAVCEYFRTSRTQAKSAACDMAAQLSRWRKTAKENGISAGSIEVMASCLDAGVARLQDAGR